MSFIVAKEWLLQNVDNKNVRIVDCRFSLSEPKKGKSAYLENHLPGAVFFDLEKDLSAPVGVHGGRHPLPDLQEFAQKLEAAGIRNEDIVVAYDEGEGAFAARFWWLLSFVGHKNVFVLDGGFSQWKQADYPVTAAIPSFEKSRFTINPQEEWLATVEDVKKIVKGLKADSILIDSREEKRFMGIEEPIDKKAGHIPGAINKPWFEGLESGVYRTVEDQKKRFAEIAPEKEVIVYCGSGVTATPNVLALKEAGFQRVKLYAGSFSDWISYEENTIEP